MDEKRNNRAVERRLKECLRHDRARIQVGHISHFGLLEMSRQRIRSSVLESSTEKCPHCGGTGHVRSVSSVALQLLRSLEEMLLKGATHNLTVRTRSEIALYLLNHKRAHLRALEERFRIAIMVHADATIGGQLSFVIEKGEQVHSLEQAKALAAQPISTAPVEEAEDEEDFLEDEEESEEIEEEAATDDAAADEAAASDGPQHAQDDEQGESAEPGPHGRGRRRRRRRGRRGGEGREAREGGFARDREPAAAGADEAPAFSASAEDDDEQAFDDAPEGGQVAEAGGEPNGDGERRRRRRGRRGGRRNRRGRDGDAPFQPEHAAENGGGEPDLAGAVADFDGAPNHEGEPQVVHVPIGEMPREFRGEGQGASHAQSEVAAEQEHAPTHEHAGEPEPVAAGTTPVAEDAPAEPPRRRSTVRERAPVAHSDDAEPSPTAFASASPVVEPVVSSPAEDNNRPRRSGWWSKRALGKE
jgi:ribonuclease E